MTLEMTNILPVTGTAMVLATQAIVIPETDTFIDKAFQYGAPMVVLIPILFFTFWQEKQRNKREAESRKERLDLLEADREERKEDRKVIADVLDRKDALIEKLIEENKK